MAAAGVAAGAFAAGRATAGGRSSRGRRPATRTRFRGEHQAGITTPAQDRLHFAAFDVTTELARRAGRAAEGVDRGRRPDDPGPAAGEIGPTEGAVNLPPDDTGEAIGLPPAA